MNLFMQIEKLKVGAFAFSEITLHNIMSKQT